MTATPPPDLPVLDSLSAVDAALAQASGPVLLLLWRDNSPRRDAEIALREAAVKHAKLQAFMVDARRDDSLVERFKLGKNAVLVGWLNGEEQLRRNRPWNTDVVGLAEQIIEMIPVDESAAEAEEEEAEQEVATPDSAPVHVTGETFGELVIGSPVPVLVDFWAEWCGPCKMVAPILDKLAKEFAGRIRIAKVDVDAEQELAGQFGIQSIPTLMFVKNGKIVGQSAGAAPEPALRDAIDQLIELEI